METVQSMLLDHEISVLNVETMMRLKLEALHARRNHHDFVDIIWMIQGYTSEIEGCRDRLDAQQCRALYEMVFQKGDVDLLSLIKRTLGTE